MHCLLWTWPPGGATVEELRGAEIPAYSGGTAGRPEDLPMAATFFVALLKRLAVQPTGSLWICFASIAAEMYCATFYAGAGPVESRSTNSGSITTSGLGTAGLPLLGNR